MRMQFKNIITILLLLSVGQVFSASSEMPLPRTVFREYFCSRQCVEDRKEFKKILEERFIKDNSERLFGLIGKYLAGDLLPQINFVKTTILPNYQDPMQTRYGIVFISDYECFMLDIRNNQTREVEICYRLGWNIDISFKSYGQPPMAS